MKILVIGSKGFIGSHCVDYFKKLNHEVVGCDVVNLVENGYVKIDSPLFDFSSLFESYKFDVCINAAGSANVSYSYKFPEKDFELNVSLVINVLGAIKKCAPACKFINFSSAAVYGNPNILPINENEPLKPLSPYGYHKMLSENLLTEYHRFFGLNTCSLRVFSVYGPRLKKQLFWDIYQKSLVTSEIQLFGTGKESRDFIYIEDLVEAVNFILNKSPFKGECINVASGIETCIDEISTLFMDKLSPNKKIIFNGEVKEGDPLNWRADIGKLKSLGFEIKTNAAEGLLQYANWLRSKKNT